MKSAISFKLAMLIIFSALLVRLGYLFLFNGPMLSADAKYDFIPLARNLATDMDYSKSGQPYLGREPAYPFFLSLCFRALGENLLAIKIIQCLLGGFLCLMVYVIAKRLFDPPVAYASTIMVILYPPLVYTNVDIATETLATLFLAGFMLLWVIARETHLPKHWLLAGVFLGIATLTRTATLVLPFLLLLFVLYRLIRRKTGYLTLTLYLLVGFLITIGGWTIRNYAASKSFVPVSINGGKSLFQGSRAEFIRSGMWKYISQQEQDKLPLEGLSEVEADRLLRRAALANLIKLLKRNPLGFGKLMLRKFFRLWYATSSGHWERHLLLLNGSLLMLAFAGIYWGWKAGRLESISPLIIIISYFAGIYTLAFPLNRYMVTIMPYVIILAAKGTSSLFKKAVGNL